jgi:putative heme iron utilization protein
MNTDHADALAAIALAHGGAGTEGPWRMVSLDTDGADLAAGEEVLRLHFSAPVRTADGVRAELVAAARAARTGK